MSTTVSKYERIAPFYDLLDLPFELRRYRAIRPLLFRGMTGHLLDAGIGTGRNCEFYPPAATVSGIDISPAMLARAQNRCPTLAAAGRLYEMDVTALKFPSDSFDAAVSSFLFCVLPDPLQVPALRELGRVVKPGGHIRLLEYVRPQRILRRIISYVWQPWIRWAYGASFDRHTEQHVPAAGLELVESRYVVDDLLKLLTVRVPTPSLKGRSSHKLLSEPTTWGTLDRAVARTCQALTHTVPSLNPLEEKQRSYNLCQAKSVAEHQGAGAPCALHPVFSPTFGRRLPVPIAELFLRCRIEHRDALPVGKHVSRTAATRRDGDVELIYVELDSIDSPEIKS